MKPEGFSSEATNIAPKPRKNYVKRTRLYRRLQNVAEKKLTLIEGCAGSGKTTLFASYLLEHALKPYYWLAFNDYNSSTEAFCHYIINTLYQIQGRKPEAVSFFSDGVCYQDRVMNFLKILIDEIERDHDIFFVFDNFHVITDKTLLAIIDFFIDVSPDNLHVIIITREEPRLCLVDIIMEDDFLLINGNELPVTIDEGRQFLQNTLNIEIDEKDIHGLVCLSEGWIGGLQLLAGPPTDQGEAALKTYDALNQYVVRYFKKEVFEPLSLRTKQFLIITSALDDFDAGISGRLLGFPEASAIIRELTSKNLFIIDKGNGVYRYHTLFLKFLQLEFHQLPDDTQKGIYLAASREYGCLGKLDESIRYQLKLHDYSAAMGIILSMGRNINGWSYLREIPLTYIILNDEISLQRYFYDFCCMEWITALELYYLVKDKFGPGPVKEVLVFLKTLMEDTDNSRLDTIDIAGIEDYAIGQVSKSIIYLCFAFSMWVQDKFLAALDFAEKALRIEEHYRNPYILYYGLSINAQVKEDLGKLNECIDIYEKIFTLLKQYDFLSPLIAANYISIVGMYLKRLNFEKAQEYLILCENLSGKQFSTVEVGYLYSLMELKILQNEDEEALELIHNMLQDSRYHNLIYTTAVMRYLFILEEVSPDILEHYLSYYQKKSGRSYLRMEDRLFYSRVLFHSKQADKALEMINLVLKEARIKNCNISIVDAILLKIHILTKSDGAKKQELLNWLREAVHYSFENKIISPYIIERDVISGLLLLLKKERSKDLSKKEKEFVTYLLKAAGGDKPVTDLSEREIEVLQVLVTGAANKDIANQLNISVSTVKTHIINIFSKLNASNRVEALNIAYERGIIR